MYPIITDIETDFKDALDPEMIEIRKKHHVELCGDDIDGIGKVLSRWGFERYTTTITRLINDGIKYVRIFQETPEKRLELGKFYYLIEEAQTKGDVKEIIPSEKGEWHLAQYKRFSGLLETTKSPGDTNYWIYLYLSRGIEQGDKVSPNPIGRPQVFTHKDLNGCLEYMMKDEDLSPIQIFAEECLQKNHINEMPNAFAWGRTTHPLYENKRDFVENRRTNGVNRSFPIQFYKIKE